jgi:hypothetical protein
VHAVPATFAHDAAMLFAHLTAAVVLAWGLRRGEARLWALARAAGRLVLLLFHTLPRVAAPAFVRVLRRRPGLEHPARHRRLLALRSSLVLRGPPTPAAVHA